MRLASYALLIAACSTASNAVTPDAGANAQPDASAPSDASDTSDASDANDESDASGSVDASVDADDSGIAWTHFELPEMGYPNGWLVANQGASPNNWAATTIAGASALNVYTSDPTGGGVCDDPSDCSASQCVGNVCRQRVKQKSPGTSFGFGIYQWRVYVASFSPADAQASVGAFAYADDEHELDFECGPGKSAARASTTLKHLDGSTGTASASEILCYVTSQANPFLSTPIAVPLGAWHVLELRLDSGTSAKYAVTWRIDGVVVATQQLTYGPTDACAMYDPQRKCTFQAFVSVENLAFIGDTYPTGRNDAYFDWFRHGIE